MADVIDFPSPLPARAEDLYQVHLTPLDHAALKAAVFETDGDRQAIDQHLAKFDSENPNQAIASREIQSSHIEIAHLQQELAGLWNKCRHTKRSRVDHIKKSDEPLPLPYLALAIFLMATAVAMILISNFVGAKFVVGSGNDLFATDETGAHLFFAPPILMAATIKGFEYLLPNDTIKAWYRTAFFACGLAAFVVWTWMSGIAFAPETAQPNWGAAANPDWISAHSGVILLWSHILIDCAGGYVAFTAGFFILLLHTKVTYEENAEHRRLKEEEAETAARQAVATGRLAAAEAYLTKRADARAALEREVRLAFRRYQQLHASAQLAKSNDATNAFLSN